MTKLPSDAGGDRRLAREAERPSTKTELAQRVADHLKANGARLVEQWIDWIRDRVATRAIEALPRNALRNHITPVVEALAGYVRNPLEGARAEMLGQLAIHAQVRHDQGYDIRELLAEFDGLAYIVTDEVVRHLSELDLAVPAADAVEVCARVATGLRAVGFVTTGLYREAEINVRREVARRLEEFGHAIAHEFRNPLNTLSLAIDTLELQPDGDEASRKESFAIMRTAVLRATELLENVRLLAMTQGAQRRGNMANLDRLVRGIVDELRPAAAEQRVEVRVAEKLPSFEVESVVATLALVNVIGNSIKYSDTSKSERWIEITAGPADQGEEMPVCEVRVKDNGIGIPSDLLPRVFQRGFRAHPERADGTGLGLNITQQILAERGGAISVQSTEGEGTTVSFTLRGLQVAPFGESSADEHPSEFLNRSVNEAMRPEHGNGQRPGDRA